MKEWMKENWWAVVIAIVTLAIVTGFIIWAVTAVQASGSAEFDAVKWSVNPTNPASTVGLKF